MKKINSILILFLTISTVDSMSYGQNLINPTATSIGRSKKTPQITSRISDIIMNANEMTHNKIKKTTELSGQVRLIFADYYLSADYVKINTKTQKLLARGNILLESQNEKIIAEEIFINYKTRNGTLRKATVTSGKVSFSGEDVTKINDEEYLLRQANFTTCSNCPASWSFASSKIKANIGDRAYISSPVFKVMGLPVLLLPPLSLPLNGHRQSGFLIPSLEGGSKSGLAYSQSYFLTMGPSQDMTLTVTRYQKSGLKGLFEYRKKMGPYSELQFNTGFIKDKTFNKLNDGKLQQKRSFIKYDNKINFLKNYTQRTNIQWLSDLYYIRDFPEDLIGRKELFEHGKSAIESKGSLSYFKNSFFASVETVINTNLIKKSPFAKNDDAVHRLPEIHYSLIEQELGQTGLNVSSDASYTNFYRNSLGYDNICLEGELCNGEVVPSGERRFNLEKDGVFNADRDLIRTGQRLQVSSIISKPFMIGKIFDTLPSVTLQHKQYKFGSSSALSKQKVPINASYSSLQTNLSIKTQLTNIYGSQETKEASLYKHIIEPEISFAFSSWSDISNHIFFGKFRDQPYSRLFEELTDNDFFNPNSSLQFDYNDRNLNKKLINFSLTNKLVKKSWLGKRAVYKDIFISQLTQSYDINEKKQPDPQAWSRLNSQLQIKLDSIELFNFFTYYPYTSLLENFTRFKLFNDSGNFLQLAYSENISVNENNKKKLNNKSKQTELGLGYSGKKLRFLGQTSYSISDSSIRYWQTTFAFKPPGECWEIGMNIRKQINRDEIDYKWVFKFDFG